MPNSVIWIRDARTNSAQLADVYKSVWRNSLAPFVDEIENNEIENNNKFDCDWLKECST